MVDEHLWIVYPDLLVTIDEQALPNINLRKYLCHDGGIDGLAMGLAAADCET